MRNVKLKMSIKWCLEIWKNVCDYYSYSSRWRQSSLSNQLVMLFVCKDPGISTTATPGTYAPFDDGIKRNIFIKNATGDVLIGEVRLHYLFLRAVHHVFVSLAFVGVKFNSNLWLQVWPGPTAFPDFTDPETLRWWEDCIRNFHSKVPVDGLWIVSSFNFFSICFCKL